MRVDPASFENSNLGQQTFKCPHCFQEHIWSKDDASLEAGACQVPVARSRVPEMERERMPGGQCHAPCG
jgi:hypothetical protein